MDSHLIIKIILFTTFSCVFSIEGEHCTGIKLNTRGVVKCSGKRYIQVEKVWLGDNCCGSTVRVLPNLISYCTNTSYCEIPFRSSNLQYRYLNVQFQCEDKDVTCLSLSSGISKNITCGTGRKIVIDEAWVDQTECPLRIPSAGGNIISNVSSICSRREYCSLQFLGPYTANVYYHCIDVGHSAYSSTTKVPQRHAITSTTHFPEISSKDIGKSEGLTNTADSLNPSAGKFVNTLTASATTSKVLQESTMYNESTGIDNREVIDGDSISGGAIAGSILGVLILSASVIGYIFFRKRREHSNDKTNIVTKYEPNYCEPWDIKSKTNYDNSHEQNAITFIEVEVWSNSQKTKNSSNGNEYSTINLEYDHIRKAENETETKDNTEETDDNVYSHLREVDIESDKYDHIVRQSNSVRRNIDGNYSFSFRNRTNDGYDNISFSSGRDNQDDFNC